MQFALDFSEDAAELEASLNQVLLVLNDIELGRGADGCGHGRLRRPSEDLLLEDAERG